MTLPVSPSKLWKSRSALRRARGEALAIARHLVAERAAPHGDEHRQVFTGAHGGEAHRCLYNAEFPAVLADLPERFTAIEWGAGMGWVAALLAATGRADRVVASEMLWDGETPTSEPNAHTLYRLAREEPRLHEVLEFHFDDTQELRRVRFRPPIHLVRADAQRFPADDACADLLYSINCLEHIPDPGAAFREAARLVRPGGLMLHTTEPLYFSAMGHHLLDIFPLPWGHLLWEAEELAALAVREAGAGREWAPGVPLAPEHLLQHVFPTLNGISPADLRTPLLAGPWRVVAWLDLVYTEHRRWYKELRPWEALHIGHDRDALLLHGLRFRLQRTTPGQRRGLRTCLRLGHHERAMLRRG